MKRYLPIAVLTVVAAVALATSALAYDRTEAESCASCHINPNMAEVVATWEVSSHANDYRGFLANTYCASCHSPMQADSEATYSSREPVIMEEWEAVTCAACHPPHDLRVAWGTPLGVYDIAANPDPNSYPDLGYSPIYREEANVLCESCHTGHGAKEYQGYGKNMFEKKLVMCIDCHMPIVPSPLDGEAPFASHTFEVASNLPWSCGTVPGGCHSNKTDGWAAKQIAKEKIHGKQKSH